MAQGKSIASITAENTGTEWIRTDKDVNITVSGTFAATIFLQKRFIDGGSAGSIIDVESYVSLTNRMVENSEDGVEFRLFCKTGGYTSGTAELRLSY